MSLDDKKENIEWCKRAFGRELENTYGIESYNVMTNIHENEWNKIAECNLLFDILKPTKHNKNVKNNYSPILQGFMNIRKGKVRFNFFELYCIVDVVPQLN